MKKLFKLFYASDHHYDFNNFENETEPPDEKLLFNTEISLNEFDVQVISLLVYQFM